MQKYRSRKKWIRFCKTVVQHIPKHLKQYAKLYICIVYCSQSYFRQLHTYCHLLKILFGQFLNFCLIGLRDTPFIWCMYILTLLGVWTYFRRNLVGLIYALLYQSVLSSRRVGLHCFHLTLSLSLSLDALLYEDQWDIALLSLSLSLSLSVVSRAMRPMAAFLWRRIGSF